MAGQNNGSEIQYQNISVPSLSRSRHSAPRDLTTEGNVVGQNNWSGIPIHIVTVSGSSRARLPLLAIVARQYRSNENA